MQLKDEIDFKDLLKNPIRLFGLSYFYFLLVGGFLGAYYIWNMNTISKNEVAHSVLSDSSQFAQDIPMQQRIMIPPVDVKIVGVASKELVAKGAGLFKTNCASCHGENGMGDGPSSIALKVKPRNFHSAEGWKNGRKVSQIYKSLQEGFLQSGMPAFNYLPAEDRFAMIHYIRTFAKDFPIDSTNELLDLEKTYSLSQGMQLPPQIPIAIAMKKISSENEAAVVTVNSNADEIENAKESESTVTLVKSLMHDEKKVLAVSLIAGNKSFDEFVKIVTADPLTIGFKAEVLRLKTDQWNALYSYFVKVSRSKKS